MPTESRIVPIPIDLPVAMWRVCRDCGAIIPEIVDVPDLWNQHNSWHDSLESPVITWNDTDY